MEEKESLSFKEKVKESQKEIWPKEVTSLYAFAWRYKVVSNFYANELELGLF